MLDDIGLGKAIANIVYLALLVIAGGGSLIALLLKKNFFALIWLSLIMNANLYLFSMGMLGVVGVILRITAIIIWPLINVYLIYKYFTSKK